MEKEKKVRLPGAAILTSPDVKLKLFFFFFYSNVFFSIYLVSWCVLVGGLILMAHSPIFVFGEEEEEEVTNQKTRAWTEWDIGNVTPTKKSLYQTAHIIDDVGSFFC